MPKSFRGFRFIRCVRISLAFAFAGLVLAGETAGGVEQQGSGWPQFRGPGRNGISHETGWLQNWPRRGLDIVWKTNVGLGHSGIAVSEGKVCTLGYRDGQDVVTCLNAETGEKIWEFSYTCTLHNLEHEGGPASTPSIDHGTVFTLSREGHIHWLGAATGEVLWSAHVPTLLKTPVPVFGFTTSPLVDGDRILFDLGIVLGLDRKSGSLAWSSYPYPASYGSPVLFSCFGQRLLACFNEYGLMVLNASDGKEVGRSRWETWSNINAVTPIVSGHRFFISSGYNTGGSVVELSEDHVAQVSQQTELVPTPVRELRTVWRNQVLCNHFVSSVLWEGFLYGMDEAILKCVDFETGEEKWAHPEFPKGTTLIVVDGKLLILSERGELVLAQPNPKAFKPLGRMQVLGGRTWTEPSFSAGRAYCRNIQGDLVCVDLRPESYP